MHYYICPVCRSSKKANLQDRLPAITHMRIALSLGILIGALTLAGMGLWSLKLALLYFPVWGVLEFAHWVEQREQTRCRVCNFDPFLYQRDWRSARAQVELRLNTIKADLIQERTGTRPAPIDSPQNA